MLGKERGTRMEHVLRPIYQERASHPHTLGVILMNKRSDATNLTDTFDSVLLIVVKEAEIQLQLNIIYMVILKWSCIL